MVIVAVIAIVVVAVVVVAVAVSVMRLVGTWLVWLLAVVVAVVVVVVVIESLCIPIGRAIVVVIRVEASIKWLLLLCILLILVSRML